MTILRDAESRLAALIEQAVRSGQYEDVAWVAGIARVISTAGIEQLSLLSDLPEEGLGAHSAVGTSNPKVEALQTAASVEPASRIPTKPSVQPPTIQHRVTYPKFERSGERLYKLGWSAKDKSVYEHRVPLDVVREVCRRMSEKATSKKPFKMEKLMPFHLQNGSEVPGYQAYLVLKWLQHFGEVDRRGNEGYIFRDPAFTEVKVDALLDQTPTRD